MLYIRSLEGSRRESVTNYGKHLCCVVYIEDIGGRYLDCGGMSWIRRPESIMHTKPKKKKLRSIL